MSLEIPAKGGRRWDLVALGEVMLRFDPGETRIHTAREFRVVAYEKVVRRQVAKHIKAQRHHTGRISMFERLVSRVPLQLQIFYRGSTSPVNVELPPVSTAVVFRGDVTLTSPSTW